MAGLYFHIPFCKRICAYCDFYKSARLEQMDGVTAAMHRELDERQDYLRGEAVTTRYFGGILLRRADIEIVLKAAHLEFHFALLGFDGFRLAGGRGCGSLFFLLLYAGDGGFADLRLNCVKTEIVKNTLDFGGVVREYHHFDTVGLLLIPNGDV